VEIEFTKSARKHRISKQRVHEVIAKYQPTSYVEDGKNKLLWVGEDARGLELEVIAVVEGELTVVIHAMPFRFKRGRGNE
jgi:hypothetical protein